MKGVVTLQTTRNYFYIQLEKRLKMHFSFDVTSVFSTNSSQVCTRRIALKEKQTEEKYVAIRLLWQGIY